MHETVYPPNWVFASTKCRFCEPSSPFCTCSKGMVTLSSFVNQRLLIFVFFCILYVSTEFFSFPFVFRPENSLRARGKRSLSGRIPQYIVALLQDFRSGFSDSFSSSPLFSLPFLPDVCISNVKEVKCSHTYSEEKQI